MGRPLAKLSAVKVEKLSKTPGMYGDGGGLWLCVSSAHAVSWLFRFSLDKRAREMGLGPVCDVPLAEARERAADARRLCQAGIDPIAARAHRRAEARLAVARAITFKDAATQYIAANRSTWKNPKHAAQWPASLETYAYPIIGTLPVGSIDIGHVTKILDPIWLTKAETAARVRQRIELVLDWAKARKYRDGDNPARLSELKLALPQGHSKIRRKRKHHAALDYTKLPAFMEQLASLPGEAPRALRFAILTAARTSEVIGATGAEINDGVWTVPAERMKADKEHEVPLSAAASALLRNDGKGLLFPSSRSDGALSNMAMLSLLKRMGRDDLTVHGFRSTFRTWAAEQTDFPSEVAEAALAHAIPDAVVAAYKRTTFFDKRRELMNAWAAFCTQKLS